MSTRLFGGKKSAIEINSSIWWEEIGNRNRPKIDNRNRLVDFAGRKIENRQVNRRTEKQVKVNSR